MLRLLLMPFAIQPDIVELSWVANFIIQGHVNVYVYYFQLFHTVYYPPGTTSTQAAQFPPLSYLFEAGYLGVLEKLGVFNFPAAWAQPANAMGGVLYPDVAANRFYFIVKAPYLAFDILGLVMLLGVLEEKYRRAGAAAWMLNPFILYIAYGWGQTDLIPASLTLVALYLAKKTRIIKNMRDGLLACLALGLAASFKLYPLALLPIFAIFAARHTGKHWIPYIAAGLLPFALAIPFLSRPFMNQVLPLGGYLTARNFSLGGGFTIFPILVIYVALIFYLISKDSLSFEIILSTSLAVFAAIYAFAIWIPNWFVWGVPFVLPVVITRPRLFGVYALLTPFYFMFASTWGNWLGLGLFFPLTDTTLTSGPISTFPNLWNMIPIWSQFTNLAYTVIGTGMFFLVYYSIKHDSTANDQPVAPILWSALILMPISLGALALFLGRSYFAGFNLANTLASKINGDPAFFGFYFALLALTVVWLVAVIWRNWQRERATRFGGLTS